MGPKADLECGKEEPLESPGRDDDSGGLPARPAGSELVDLRWDQIDFTTATMHVRRVKEGTPSTHPILGDESRALRRQSGAWTDFSLATRKHRENIVGRVISSVCDQPLSRVDKAAIQLGRERRAATPTQAKHFVTTMRGMFTWALDQPDKLVRSDPTHGIGFKRSRKEKKSEGFPVRTDDDIAAFERRWPRGTRERLMFDIFCFTGLRRGDAAVVGQSCKRRSTLVRPVISRSLQRYPVSP
jgi:integrase